MCIATDQLWSLGNLSCSYMWSICTRTKWMILYVCLLDNDIDFSLLLVCTYIACVTRTYAKTCNCQGRHNNKYVHTQLLFIIGSDRTLSKGMKTLGFVGIYDTTS